MDQRRAGRPLLQVPRGLPGPRRTVPAAVPFAVFNRPMCDIIEYLRPTVRRGLRKFPPNSQLCLPIRLAVLVACGAVAGLTTPAAPAFAQARADSAAVAAVVERYHGALSQGDSVAALAQLAEDAVILESGHIESRQEYRSHHLGADIAFARAVKGTRSPVRVSVLGDVAWTTATSTVRGEFRGKPVNSSGVELMVLTRSADGWKISAIHWSSHNPP
jgi:ketosteroid isomerase-like protein